MNPRKAEGVTWMKRMGEPQKRVSIKSQMVANRDHYLMLLPFSLVFFTFMVIPVLAAMVLSFTDFNMVQMPTFNGIDNYIRMLLDDDVFLIAVKNTMLFALITGPVSYFACLFLAWLVNELRPTLRAFVTILLYIPSISSNIYVIWTYIFSGDEYGFLNGLLMRFGLLLEPIQWLTDTQYVLGVVIVVQLWISLGTSFLSFVAGFQGIDHQLYEAGAIDGIRNRVQEFWKITLPCMGPQLMFGAVMQIGSSFAAGSISTQLIGTTVSTDYAATTIVTHMQDVGTVRFEMGYASAIAMFLFVVMILFNHLIGKILGKFSA